MSTHVDRMKLLIEAARRGFPMEEWRELAMATAGYVDAISDSDEAARAERWSDVVPALLAQIASGYGTPAMDGELLRCAKIADCYSNAYDEALAAVQAAVGGAA